MKKNGKTRAGAQRWRCKSCGSSAVIKNDTSSRWLKAFVSWLLGKLSQAELKGSVRTFRERTHRFWKIWPIVPACDEVHHVACMDGIWLSRKCVILVACTDAYVIGCHLARTENSKDWGCLMARIAAPASSCAMAVAGLRGQGDPCGPKPVSKGASSMCSAR